MRFKWFRGHASSLITSYLTLRQQFASINNHSTQVSAAGAGAGAGSILGCFLLNMRINNIVRINTSTEFIIYADATTLMLFNENADELADNANKTQRRHEERVQLNISKVNENKTKAALF